MLCFGLHRELRDTNIHRYYKTWPTTTELLMNNESKTKIRNLVTFLYRAFRKR